MQTVNKSLFFSFIFLNSLLIFPVFGNNVVSLDDGSRYFFNVICTDFCGTNALDITDLPANLYFEIKENIANKITILTFFNVTTSTDGSQALNFEQFEFIEQYNVTSRENLEKKGSYAWQWLNSFDETVNVSIPANFIIHTPSSYLNNTHLLKKTSESEDLKFSGVYITAQKYEGSWEYQDPMLQNRTVSLLTIYYDTSTKLLVSMEVTLFILTPLNSKDVFIDPIGSFKMIRLYPSTMKTTNFELILIWSLVVLIMFQFIKRKKK